ncbi:MAG: hypothetical protein IR162_05930, partial [Rhodococcus sp.]|nr:hypothetical protein [Rhodococcus sp. (in: high G+C Gram-positive bacteria)]
ETTDDDTAAHETTDDHTTAHETTDDHTTAHETAVIDDAATDAPAQHRAAACPGSG